MSANIFFSSPATERKEHELPSNPAPEGRGTWPADFVYFT
jgi:hypothetical protein